jgi:hypothetical protein
MSCRKVPRSQGTVSVLSKVTGLNGTKTLQLGYATPSVQNKCELATFLGVFILTRRDLINVTRVETQLILDLFRSHHTLNINSLATLCARQREAALTMAHRNNSLPSERLNAANSITNTTCCCPAKITRTFVRMNVTVVSL